MILHTRLVKVVILAALTSVLLGNGCTTDYVTGKRTFSLVSESQEIAMGKEADPQIVAEYGLYKNQKLASYVDDLGQSLAKKSHRPQLEYTFRVLDSPVVNAFALPGGYVYVTRGILAHFNSEDELAGVLGHEIGHVTARHSAEQISRAQLAGLGLGLGSLISEEFRKFADVAGAGLGLLFLKFSREQESESDVLGVEYSSKLGYDAHKMAGFFRTLKGMRDEGGQGLPSFLSTHPDPGDREVRVHQLADDWQSKALYRPLKREKYHYVQKINGIVYGDDPQQGYFENQTFYHPKLRFKFPVPANWTPVNTPARVQMTPPDKKAAIQLTLGKSANPQQEADDFAAKNEATVKRRVSTTVHGFPATVLQTSVMDGDKELRVLSYFILKDQKVYIFHGFTTAELYGDYFPVFTQVMSGFDELQDHAALNKKPSVLRIEQAPKSGDLATVLGALGVDQDMWLELALLNGMTLSDRVQKGEWVKIVKN
ncbi:MAG: M48 family metalloprotease [Candidatus Latescibacteria bacterium]|nr:M48 family metalloprotease [Candidatus Latescibacterota bacterium]NIO56302.1 M48 family metalloprotease [Candidatus Latescibacterota bacterium]